MAITVLPSGKSTIVNANNKNTLNLIDDTEGQSVQGTSDDYTNNCRVRDLLFSKIKEEPMKLITLTSTVDNHKTIEWPLHNQVRRLWKLCLRW